jgi:two-component system NtrC family sensor kinase
MEQLRRADRLKTAGQLAAGIAHELGTPLNVVRGRAEIVADDAGASSVSHKSGRIIVEQVDRMSTIIRQLLDFTRRGKSEVTTCDLGKLARKSIELLGAMAKKQSVSLALVAPERAVPVRGDAGLLGQVIVNLIVNGIQARGDEGGFVRVEVGAREDGNRPWAVLQVVDDGVGIARENLAQIFEPFFTTKEIGRGTGLGLWVSWGIVTELGGAIEVESEPGKGTRFSVRLPLDGPTGPDAAAAS